MAMRKTSTQKLVTKHLWSVYRRATQRRRLHGLLQITRGISTSNTGHSILLILTLMLKLSFRITEDDKSGKYTACVQRQNHKKYGQMTIAKLCKN